MARYQPRHSEGYAKRRMIRRILVIAVSVILTVFILHLFIEPKLLTVDSVVLSGEDLPADIGQLRIVYLTDLHTDFFYSARQLSELTTKVNSLNPDLLLLGGDYASSMAGTMAFFKNFPNMHARYGIYAVLGEHDREGSPEDMLLLRNAIMTAGVTSLINETAVVRIGNSSITIVGSDDLTHGDADIPGIAGKVQSSDYVILMAHSPNAIEPALRSDSADGQRKWFDLGLFGQTHGGQISFLGQALGISDVAPRYLTGWRQENRIDLLVSNGVGTSVVPMRFHVPPQIHLITVRSGR